MKYKNIYPTPSEYTYGTNTCEYIIHHHTGTGEGTTAGVLDGLNKRQDYASAHYLVSENGDIYKIGNDTDILWHAGTSAWDGRTDMNKYSIGIEIIGPLSNGGFTDEQRASFKELVNYLSLSHDIPKSNVIRHKDISPGRKIDVQDTFWNNDFSDYREYIDSLFVDVKDNKTLRNENEILRRRADETDVLLKKALKANNPNKYADMNI